MVEQSEVKEMRRKEQNSGRSSREISRSRRLLLVKPEAGRTDEYGVDAKGVLRVAAAASFTFFVQESTSCLYCSSPLLLPTFTNITTESLPQPSTLETASHKTQPQPKLQPLHASLSLVHHQRDSDVRFDTDERVTVHYSEAGGERWWGCEEGSVRRACERRRVSTAETRNKDKAGAPVGISFPALTHPWTLIFSSHQLPLLLPKYAPGSGIGASNDAPSA
jgi:hypothetical protein